MPTVTKTTVDVHIGDYTYRADVDGNQVELFRDGVHAGTATWSGGTIADFPKALSIDAKDALTIEITKNLKKAWMAKPETERVDDGKFGPLYDVAPGAKNTPDAGNRGQMGNEPDKPSRQGEKEVGTGGPNADPNTGELGGQAIKPHRRAVGDGFTPPAKKR